MTLKIPDKLYHLILATWTAIVFGCAFAWCHHVLSTPQNLITLSAPNIRALEGENYALRKEIVRLENQVYALESNQVASR
jgi:hypothetical protein